MFGSEALEVLIGLSVIYLVFAVLASALTEVISMLFALRAHDLRNGVRMLLQDQDEAVTKFFDHPVIKALRHPGRKRLMFRDQLPSYIPADLFARVYKSLYDAGELTEKAAPPAVINAFGGAQASARELQTQLEAWFNATMDRVTGWYKRKAKFIVLVVASIVVIGSNADTISIANRLWQDPTVRAQVVAVAENQEDPDIALAEASEIRDQLSGLSLLGWVGQSAEINDPRETPVGWENWLLKGIGLVVTIGAVSLGAPFWFDLMSQLLSLRSKLSGGQTSGGGAGNIPPAVNTSTSMDSALPPAVRKDAAISSRAIQD